MDMKDAWNLRPAHMAPTNYFDAESPALSPSWNTVSQDKPLPFPEKHVPPFCSFD